MPLNFVKKDSNMYGWVDATINFCKGLCPHQCNYCYAKYINLYPPKLDDKEFKTKLIDYENIEVKEQSDLFGESKTEFKKTVKPLSIFVGSSIDMYADNIPFDWVLEVYDYCKTYPQNTYIFQSKNPLKMLNALHALPKNTMFGITLETNRHYPHIMNQAPKPIDRWNACKGANAIQFITIEPIIQFSLDPFIKMITDINPKFINIGANTNLKVPLPEPSKGDIINLYNELVRLGYEVILKSNLSRIIGDIKL